MCVATISTGVFSQEQMIRPSFPYLEMGGGLWEVFRPNLVLADTCSTEIIAIIKKHFIIASVICSHKHYHGQTTCVVENCLPAAMPCLWGQRTRSSRRTTSWYVLGTVMVDLYGGLHTAAAYSSCAQPTNLSVRNRRDLPEVPLCCPPSA